MRLVIGRMLIRLVTTAQACSPPDVGARRNTRGNRSHQLNVLVTLRSQAKTESGKAAMLQALRILRILTIAQAVIVGLCFPLIAFTAIFITDSGTRTAMNIATAVLLAPVVSIVALCHAAVHWFRKPRSAAIALTTSVLLPLSGFLWGAVFVGLLVSYGVDVFTPLEIPEWSDATLTVVGRLLCGTMIGISLISAILLTFAYMARPAPQIELLDTGPAPTDETGGSQWKEIELKASSFDPRKTAFKKWQTPRARD